MFSWRVDLIIYWVFFVLVKVCVKDLENLVTFLSKLFKYFGKNLLATIINEIKQNII